jgi:hypothetical protein
MYPYGSNRFFMKIVKIGFIYYLNIGPVLIWHQKSPFHWKNSCSYSKKIDKRKYLWK